MDETVTKKAELVIDALQYAHDHHLDVNKKEDVIIILNILDPEYKENIDEFMELLKTSDVFMNMQARANEEKKLN